MTLPDFIDYCLAKPGTEETTPFGPEVLVYKVCGKMFALCNPDDVPPEANLKCDPDRAIELRDEYEAVRPGYHMNKRHWNTVTFDGTMSDDLLRDLIDHSYELVVNGLKKADRDTLK
ncbi:hypothetical protein NT6N_31420 [Oceaniferula spumae]|uniref:MmcQ-like protein n=1 Tax=Oceaniferula spumae TaxID=2979115 RepID=A0AAT9FQD3_9BACT